MYAIRSYYATAPGFSVEAAYGNLEGYLEDIEKQILNAALQECRWNKTATASLSYNFV